jgi:hypothetical protein
MNGDGRPGQRRQRRGGAACDRSGAGRGRSGLSSRGAPKTRDGESTLGGRTATRALIAVGTYVAQDLRDAEGLTRPMLRRAALRLAVSRREPARRLGYAYLRLDPPAPEALPERVQVIDTTSAASPRPAIASTPTVSAQPSGGEEPAI